MRQWSSTYRAGTKRNRAKSDPERIDPERSNRKRSDPERSDRKRIDPERDDPEESNRQEEGIQMIKDRKKLILLIKAAVLLAVAAAVFFAGKEVGASTTGPGSQSDPLVTLSYLEKRLKEGGTTGNSYDGASFTEVSFSAGEKLMLDDGAEAVVIRGNGSVIGQGLVNLTTGELFKEGTSVVLYSDFLAAGTKCGIKASGTMKVYVKGGYSID